MVQASIKHSIDSMLESGEQLYALARHLDIDELQGKVPEYISILEKYFLDQDKQDISEHDFEKLKQLLSMHKKITDLISQEKDNISKSLKQLHAGKEMQSIYP